MTVETKREPASRPARDPRELGLCSTCNSIDTCTGRATWVGPVHHCEEFDDAETQQKKPNLKAVPPQAAEVDESAAAGARQGLCVNCEHRDSCSFPVVEGGVWHCEEYE